MESTGVPGSYLCPITQQIMQDPVILADGHSYERSAILQWLNKAKTSPMTGLPIEKINLIPNITLKNSIDEWKNKKNATPRPAHVSTSAKSGPHYTPHHSHAQPTPHQPTHSTYGPPAYDSVAYHTPDQHVPPSATTAYSQGNQYRKQNVDPNYYHDDQVSRKDRRPHTANHQVQHQVQHQSTPNDMLPPPYHEQVGSELPAGVCSQRVYMFIIYTLTKYILALR